MSIGLMLFAVSLLALFMAVPIGVATAVCVLTVRKDRRRHVLLLAAAGALLATIAALLLPLGVAQFSGALLLILGVVGTAVGAVLLLLRRDGTATGTMVGLISAPLAMSGHLLESAPAFTGLLAPSGPGAPGAPMDGFRVVLGSGLIAGALAVLAVAAVLLLVRRAWEPLGTGLAVGGIAAALAIGMQIVLLLLRSQLTGAPAPSMTTTLMVTVLGLVVGTAFGAMRADGSGALAGMPRGNH